MAEPTKPPVPRIGDGATISIPQAPRAHWKIFANTRNDAPGGFQNVATGLGTRDDKRTYGRFALNVVTGQEARELWRGNDLAKRIIEDRAQEALREGFTLKMEDTEAATAIMKALGEIRGPRFIGNGWKKNILHARYYENAGGGGAIWPMINDGAGSMAEPLNEANITRIERLQVFEARELRPAKKYDDATDPKYGEVATYYVMPIGEQIQVGDEVARGLTEIHETRLILFPGVRITREEQSGCEPGFGDNILTPVRTVLNDFELTFAAAAHLLQDFAQAVLKLEGLAEILAIDDGAAGNRLAETNKWRSVLRALVLDSKDSFERVTTPLTGYPEMLDRFMLRLCAAAKMPATKLMGMSPTGLGSTGQGEQTSWYDSCSAEQEYLTPMIKRLVQLYMLSKESPTQGKEPAEWSIEFYPLWQPSELEQEQVKKTRAERYALYLDRQVVSPEEVAFAEFGGSEEQDLVIDFEEREALEPAAPPVVHAAAPGQPGAPPPSDQPPGAPADSTQTQPPPEGTNQADNPDQPATDTEE